MCIDVVYLLPSFFCLSLFREHDLISESYQGLSFSLIVKV